MSKLQANLLLLIASALWGFGNVAQKTVLEHLDALSAVGLRCLIALLLLLPLLRLGKAAGSPAYWISLLRVSAPFAAGLVIQQAAYLSTSVTNASFLINTATVITPVAAWLLLGERPGRTMLTAASMTLVGALLLSGGIGGAIGQGDLAAIVAAVCFSLWMVELGRHMKQYGDAVATACAQFFLAAIATLPLAAMEGSLSIAAITAAAPELIVLGVFSTAIAFGIQTVALRHTSSSHAAVIISAESVFGAAGAAMLLGERVSPLAALGCALVLAGIVIVAMPTRKTAGAAGQARRHIGFRSKLFA